MQDQEYDMANDDAVLNWDPFDINQHANVPVNFKNMDLEVYKEEDDS